MVQAQWKSKDLQWKWFWEKWQFAECKQQKYWKLVLCDWNIKVTWMPWIINLTSQTEEKSQEKLKISKNNKCKVKIPKGYLCGKYEVSLC